MRAYQVTVIILIAAVLCMPGCTAAAALKEGKWTGTYLNLHDKRYKIQYNVAYAHISDGWKLQIQMINLDLEPTPEYTFQLSDIELKDRQLRFKIPGKYEIKRCVLERQEDNKFRGTCQSDKDEEGETSQISMIPPPDDEPSE